MQTCVFTPTHETGILMADIIPYAGSHDTRLGRESSWPLVPAGTHVFSGRWGSRGFFAPGPVERRFCFVGIVMPWQAPRGMKMGSLPCVPHFSFLSGRMGPHRAGAEVVSYWCHELV